MSTLASRKNHELFLPWLLLFVVCRVHIVSLLAILPFHTHTHTHTRALVHWNPLTHLTPSLCFPLCFPPRSACAVCCASVEARGIGARVAVSSAASMSATQPST